MLGHIVILLLISNSKYSRNTGSYKEMFVMHKWQEIVTSAAWRINDWSVNPAFSKRLHTLLSIKVWNLSEHNLQEILLRIIVIM